MGVTHLVLIGTLAAAAGQGLDSQPKPQPPAGPVQELVSPGKKPSLRFLPLPSTDPSTGTLVVQRREPPAEPKPQPRVVCGLVVIPVTPAADPKMIVQPKPDPKPDLKIRTITPRVCNE